MDNNSLIIHITAQLHAWINSVLTADKMQPSPFNNGQLKPWNMLITKGKRAKLYMWRATDSRWSDLNINSYHPRFFSYKTPNDALMSIQKQFSTGTRFCFKFLNS